jgi:hypothetical protein
MSLRYFEQGKSAAASQLQREVHPNDAYLENELLKVLTLL